MFTVRRILLIGLLAASATGCAVAPYESHVVHEVYDPYPYAYPRTQIYFYQTQSFGYRHRRHDRHDHVDRGRSHAGKPSMRYGDRSDRRHQHVRDAKPIGRDVTRAQPRSGSSARSERAEPRRESNRSARHARNEGRDNDRRERR